MNTKVIKSRLVLLAVLLAILTLAFLFSIYKVKDKTQIKFEAPVTSFSASHYYVNDGKNIYFKFLKDKLVKLEGVDLNSFAVMAEPEYIAFDKKHVYITGYVVPGADPKTFESIGYRTYYKDHNSVYYEERINPSNIRTSLNRLPELDPKSVRKVNDYIVADNNSVYYRGKKIEVLDPKSFHMFKAPYFTDDKATYLLDERNWFQSNFFLISRSPMEKIFTNNLYGGGYISIGNQLYFGTTTMIGSDISSFKVLTYNENDTTKRSCTSTYSCFYAKDKNNIYYMGQIIPGADINTFKLSGDTDILKGLGKSSDDMSQSEFAVDSNHAYFLGEVIPGADVKTFAPVISGGYNFEYAKDSLNVYWKNHQIMGADPATFKTVVGQQPYEGCGAGRYSFDKNNVYYEYKIIPGADVKTFKVVYGSGSYAEDANYFYEGAEKANRSVLKICEMG